MKKFVILGVVGGILGVGVPAIADVNVRADVDKLKLIRIVENITINKFIDINALVTVTAIKAAEADTAVNQANYNNHACTNCDEKQDTFRASIHDNEGVINSNQSAGNMNNQGNAYSIAIDVETFDPPTGTRAENAGFADAQSAVEQNNGVLHDAEVNIREGPTTQGNPDLGTPPSDPTLVNGTDNVGIRPSPNTVNTVNILFRNALIATSVHDNSGIVGVNQSTGNMNNQANAVAMSVSLASSGVALSEADLGQVTAFNDVGESDSGGPVLIGIHKRASITGSITGNNGIVGANQSVGNMANQANNVSLAWVQGTAGATVPDNITAGN